MRYPIYLIILLGMILLFSGCVTGTDVTVDQTIIPTETKLPTLPSIPTPTITNIPIPTPNPKITVIPSINFAGDEQNLIAFQVYDDKNRTVTIFLIHPDGTKLTGLVSLSGTLLGRDYSWSPDGTKLAFSHAPESGLKILDYFQIFTIKIDTGKVRKVTDDKVDHKGPIWSPDGTRIAFKAGDNYLLSTVSSSGGAMTIISENRQLGSDYSWSPDGTRIAFEIGYLPWDFSIWFMDADGSNPHQFETKYLDLETEYNYTGSPVWTPDGNHLVFLKQHDLYYGDIEGEFSNRLTFTLDYPEIWFDLSPNGSMIAFLNSDGSYVSLKIIDLQGNVIAEERLGESYEVDFDWSNDSQTVVLTSDNQLWLYSVEDQSLIKLLDCPGACRNPQWQP